MVDLSAIAAATTSLKSAFDIARGIAELKTAVDIQGQVFELQRVILAAQRETFAANEAQSTLLKQVDSLEKEITRLEAWDAEKQRYQLTEIGPSVFAYSLKPDARGSDPDHKVCAACYEEGRRGVLQQESRPLRKIALVCPNGHNDIFPNGNDPNTPPRSVNRGGGGSFVRSRLG